MLAKTVLFDHSAAIDLVPDFGFVDAAMIKPLPYA